MPIIKIEQLKTLEGANNFFNEIPEICRKNLIGVMKEELEMIKKFKIMVTETTYYHDKVKRADIVLEYIERDLTKSYLDNIFKNNHVRWQILDHNLISKIDNQNLNPKEAEQVILLLSEKCSLWEKIKWDGRFIYRNVNSYTFRLSPGQRDDINIMSFKSFNDVLNRNNFYCL